MAKKESYIPLTINKAATRARIVDKDKQLKLCAKRLRIVESLLCRILAAGKSAYPVQIHEKSKYQRALRRLNADGLLVQASDDVVLDQAA